MLIASFAAGPWQTNCYLLATGPGAECVIVDPGVHALDPIGKLVREQRLHPVAVLLTHGHLDHTFSVSPLCAAHDVPCWVHPADRALLADPFRALGPDVRGLLDALGEGGRTFAEPGDVRELVDGSVLEIAAIDLSAVHAPGHTPGSVMFRTPYPPDPQIDSLLLSGDVLFAGSIGRTDLPGGNHADMLESLRSKVVPLPDSVVVLPGHGGQTTIARERAANPFLRDLIPARVDVGGGLR